MIKKNWGKPQVCPLTFFAVSYFSLSILVMWAQSARAAARQVQKLKSVPRATPLHSDFFSNLLQLILLLIAISTNSRPNRWSVDRLGRLLTLSSPLIIAGITQNTPSNKYCLKCNLMFYFIVVRFWRQQCLHLQNSMPAKILLVLPWLEPSEDLMLMLLT